MQGEDETNYSYDEFGRLTQKLLPNNNKEVMDYLPGGHLNSLEMYDVNGLLDKYTYDYDNQSSKTITGSTIMGTNVAEQICTE
ncbi:hypothetical protein [Butyrivibrio fibrisolvens]|uniref:YD repeat-containing protein n=1 Tax=Butyrivibrio fibrisolvens TaxID=831 RepID=A0A317G0E5_BUTFI|nr:hypothetical protein [Butyrivibrio fibrisolvens]PWT26641.1 hypothetical protein CPT75_05620 [Butyrivibrio fibrisolvens]